MSHFTWSALVAALVLCIVNVEAEAGSGCTDVKLESKNHRLFSVRVPKSRKIVSMTLTTQHSKSKCEFGKSYGFDGVRVYVTRGCRGTFKVCVEVDEKTELEAQKSGGRKCKKPFYNVDGTCMAFEGRARRSNRDAALRCADVGARLLVLDDVSGLVSKLRNIRNTRGLKIYIGSVTNAEKLNTNDFVQKIASKYKIQRKDVNRACRRFVKGASVSDRNFQSSVSSKCLIIDLDKANGLNLVDCRERLPFLCEQVDAAAEGEGIWSKWINGNDDTKNGNIESLWDIIKDLKKGKIDDKGIKLCKKPVAMQCREVGTNNLYSKSETRGLKLDKACEKNQIRCRNSRQKGKKCPDFEVRFLCPEDAISDCADNEVRKACERRNRECVMSPLGAQCVKRRRQRSGREKIGVSTCEVNGVKYNVHQCLSKGDPHYWTLDGRKFDFQGRCSYNLIETCKNFKPTDEFPAFRVTTMNELRDVSDTVTRTKAFNFHIGGVTYSFTRGKMFIDRREVNAVGYSDDIVNINADPNGDSYHLTISTQHCLQLRWDNKYGLFVEVPDFYKNHVCGLCGDFDGDETNDMDIPGRGTVSPLNLGKYYMVGGEGAEECVDIVKEPEPCPDSMVRKFSDNQFCGVLNPDGDSALAKAVLVGSDKSVIEANKIALQLYFEECVNDHCWMKDFDVGRCHELEAIIREVLQQLNMDGAELDSQWRRQSGCEVDPKTICGGRDNMEYRSSYLQYCQNTCAEPTKEANCDDLSTSQGCVCKDGFVLDSSLNCVPEAACSNTCTFVTDSGAQMIIEDGQTVVLEPCLKQVTCREGEAEEEEMDSCSDNGECIDRGRKCVCRPGFVGDGHICSTDTSCRDGYSAFGSKCYKFVPDPLDFHSAAISCGAEGARLARYDSEGDLTLESFHKKIPELMLLSKGKSRTMRCNKGNTCTVPNGELVLSVRVKKSRDAEKCDEQFDISEDRRKLIVKDCNTKRFIIETVEARDTVFDATQVMTYIGGNTEVLGPNRREGKAPFQVDAPRMSGILDVDKSVGCFQGSTNPAGQFVISVIDCKVALPFICEYDNTKQNDFDPLDFMVIRKEVKYQQAIEECEKKGRPLATIVNSEQLDVVKKRLSEAGRDGWLSLKFTAIAGYAWATGVKPAFTNWKEKPEPQYRGQEYFCVTMDRRSGFWETEKCDKGDYFPVCGPPVTDVPYEYTPYYPGTGISSLTELIRSQKRAGEQDYICSNPPVIECSARKPDGEIITNFNQKSRILTCRRDQLACQSGMGVDCSTFRVRFLCPQVDNQCVELDALGATACDGGRSCFPVSNHYICKCPSGSIFSEHTHSCAKFCGECSLWGDPHYTTLSGNKYDFMGLCKYLLTGACDFDERGEGPSFAIYSINKQCGQKEGASCINFLEVHLKNIRVSRGGVTVPSDFTFEVSVGASSYKLNDVEITQTEFGERGAFSVTLKKGYFNLVVQALDLSLLLSGTKFRIQVPGAFRDKMCGLCGDCGNNLFRLRNGTLVDPGKSGSKWNKDAMRFLASDWAVYDAELGIEECPIPPAASEEEACSAEMKADLAKPNACGVFMDPNSPLKECFDKSDLVAETYYEDCMYDACETGEPEESVCKMVKAFAQECSLLGVRLDWRRDDFCPMNCNGKIYRVDASCEPTCGQNSLNRMACTEMPEEGCVCPGGLMRQGENCVPPEKCGCQYSVVGTGVTVTLKPGDSVILPECNDKATCIVNDDGTSSLNFEKLVISPYAICSATLPVVVKCAKGFIMQEDGVTCEKDPTGCVGDYRDEDGLCVKPLPDPKVWRQAVQACNEQDGTLVYVDAEPKLNTLGKLMEEQGFDTLYITGKVKASVSVNRVNFGPVLSDIEKGTVPWYNFDFANSILNNIMLGGGLSIADIPTGGLELSLVVQLQEGTPVIVAVPSDTPANFVCEQRKVEEEDTTFYGPCNTDSDMSDNGDQENRYDMVIDPDCLICPVPMEVRCDVNAEAAGAGTVDGTCQLSADGLYYSCNEGEDCIDKGVSTKCAKDADECATDRHDCPANSDCINTVGAYICKCKDDFPLMVNGRCEEALSCTMSGPDTPEDFVYRINGFSNIPGLFDYSCKFKMAAVCDYDPSSGLPLVEVYVFSTRVGGELQPYLAGSIYDPRSLKLKQWAAQPDGLSAGKILYGLGGDKAAETFLSFSDREIETRFHYSTPGTLVIQHARNYFRITLSFTSGIRVDFSSQYREQLCGVCSAEPATPGIAIELTEEQQKDFSTDPAKPCQPRTTVVEEPKEPESCDAEIQSFCTTLENICQVPAEQCESAVCDGTVEVCDYLADAMLGNCIVEDLNRFIEPLECDSKCGPNMRVRYAARLSVPTCDVPMPVASVGESSLADFSLRCTCNDGFVSNNKLECVRPEECGCKMDGAYYPPGYQWRNTDCSEMNICLGKNEVKTVQSSCGTDAICAQTERGSVCQCKAGTFGNPDKGCEEGVVEEDGSKTCYNFIIDDQRSEERCECNMGFVSNCDDCEDVDECREGLHDCDLAVQECVNIMGGYDCVCAEGYKERNGECADNNECQDPTICGPNAQCVNAIGSYRCVCCHGFMMGPQGCVRDTEIDLPEGAPCCALCNNRELCAEEALKTYCLTKAQKEFGSYKDMYLHACLNNAYLGPGAFSEGECTGNPEEPSGGGGGPPELSVPTSCDDPGLCGYLPSPPLSLASGEICGPLSAEVPQTYASYCDMVIAVCKELGGPGNLPDTSFINAQPGACPSVGVGTGRPLSEPIFTSWTSFGPCQFNDADAGCGEGQQMRNRQVAPYLDGRPVRIVEEFEVSETRPCFERCSPGDNPNPEISCPDVSFCNEIQPVCGILGVGAAMTFNSECELNVKACEENIFPTMLYGGFCDPEDSAEDRRYCDGGPVFEAVKYDIEKENMHCVGAEVTIGTCGNLLCEGKTSTCCKAVSFEQIQVDVDCFHLETKEYVMDDVHVYISATACECQGPEPEPDSAR